MVVFDLRLWMTLTPFPPLSPSLVLVYKLDYHGPEEGEEHDHH